jgi:hypothetical protein
MCALAHLYSSRVDAELLHTSLLTLISLTHLALALLAAVGGATMAKPAKLPATTYSSPSDTPRPQLSVVLPFLPPTVPPAPFLGCYRRWRAVGHGARLAWPLRSTSLQATGLCGCMRA